MPYVQVKFSVNALTERLTTTSRPAEIMMILNSRLVTANLAGKDGRLIKGVQSHLPVSTKKDSNNPGFTRFLHLKRPQHRHRNKKDYQINNKIRYSTHKPQRSERVAVTGKSGNPLLLNRITQED